MRIIRIALEGTPNDYPLSLLPLVIKHLGYHIEWCKSTQADLKILGPFQKRTQFKNYIPKPLRPFFIAQKKNNNFLTLFHTQENIRHDLINADFSISFDLGVIDKNHFRLPYWMEMIDWEHEVITKNVNLRYGRLLSLDRLMQPLGNDFKHRLQKIAFITSHLNEPRKLLYKRLNSLVPIEGFGPHFDQTIRSHHQSSFKKFELLQNYAFNLCPENSLYPGYVTEKIPEAFYAGCIPLTWVDSNVVCDFNPKAMINLMPMVHEDFLGFKKFLSSSISHKNLAEQSLIIRTPSLEPFKLFLMEVLRQASS
jgi:hypothetical protein